MWPGDTDIRLFIFKKKTQTNNKPQIYFSDADFLFGKDIKKKEFKLTLFIRNDKHMTIW